MSHKALDFHKILHAAEIIRTQGEKVSGLYSLAGVTLDTGHDGYSITLSTNEVFLTIGFHNTFKLTSPGRAETERFYKLIDRVIEDA